MQFDRRSLLKAALVTAVGAASTGLTATGHALAAEPLRAAGVDWNALRAKVTGGVVLPGEPGYDGSKAVFNTLFDDRMPAAVAHCVNPAEVQACVQAAGGRIPLAARAGGHSYGGYSTPDGGLVVDVGPMRGIDVRPDGTAVIGAGAKLGEVYAALADADRCLPAGSCPTVGISGLTLGGGIGVLTRKYGLTCDRLLAAEIVTADGEFRTVSAESEPDLFWALRGGGGGNFGIVTSFTFSTEPAPSTTVFSVRFPVGSAPAVLGAWQEWIAGAPPELWANLVLSGGDQVGARVGGCFVGPAAALAPLIDDLVRRAGVEPDRRTSLEKDYLSTMNYFAGSSDRQTFTASSRVLGGPVPDPAALTGLLAGRVGMDMLIDSLGGAVSTVDDSATAFPHRTALATVQIYSATTPQDAQQTAAAIAEVGSGLDGIGVRGGYVNYLDPAQEDWAAAYYMHNLPRLREIADRYDPERIFAFPQGV